MTSGTIVNQRVAAGFAKAASELGFAYQWYRPQAGAGALDAGGLQGSITAYITADVALKSSQPPNDTKGIWYAAFDPTDTQAGDYFVGAAGTFFIASQFLPAPPALVYCNATMTLTRAGGDAPGPGARWGTGSNPVTLALAFPGWIKSAERRTNPALAEPGDVPLPSANILLPRSITQEIVRGDTIAVPGTIAATYVVQSADLQFNCWNIVALRMGG